MTSTLIRRGSYLRGLPSDYIAYNVHKVTNDDGSGYVVVAVERENIVSVPVSRFWFCEPTRYGREYGKVLLSAMGEACRTAAALTLQQPGLHVRELLSHIPQGA